MKTAVIALTPNGAAIALKISEAINAKFFAKEGRYSLNTDDVQEFTSLKLLVKDIIYQFDALIFIMATGITVRMIAPYIVHKTIDPAIIVIDEKGINAISLLAGHIGGANELTRQVAALIGANPVITTATDINNKIAADMIAVKLGLRIENIAQLKKINADIVVNKTVDFYIDKAMHNVEYYHNELKRQQIAAKIINISQLIKPTNSTVLITDSNNYINLENVLVLKPGKLAVGIGCRKDTTEAEILFALQMACKQIGKSLTDIVSLASTIIKSKEAGLLAVAKQLNIPIYFYENDQIQMTIETYHLSISNFVYQQIGVGNICESAAIISSQSKKIILRKTKYPKVTIAIAWEK